MMDGAEGRKRCGGQDQDQVHSLLRLSNKIVVQQTVWLTPTKGARPKPETPPEALLNIVCNTSVPAAHGPERVRMTPLIFPGFVQRVCARAATEG